MFMPLILSIIMTLTLIVMQSNYNAALTSYETSISKSLNVKEEVNRDNIVYRAAETYCLNNSLDVNQTIITLSKNALSNYMPSIDYNNITDVRLNKNNNTIQITRTFSNEQIAQSYIKGEHRHTLLCLNGSLLPCTDLKITKQYPISLPLNTKIEQEILQAQIDANASADLNTSLDANVSGVTIRSVVSRNHNKNHSSKKINTIIK